MREEEVEDDDYHDGEELVSFGSKQTNSASNHFNATKRDDDFRVFLQNQASTGKAKIELRGSKTRRKPAGKTKQSGQVKSAGSQKLKCYELFCVHQASLLVHRSQVLVEAERLSRRLDQLMSADDD